MSSLFARRIGLLVLLAGCAAPALEEDSAEQWAGLTADDGAAVLEDASANEDSAAASNDVDDRDDPAEADEDADAERPEGVAAKATYTNAVLASCADPGLIKLGNSFEVACTGGGYPSFTSTDLVHWKSNGTLFSKATRPKWRATTSGPPRSITSAATSSSTSRRSRRRAGRCASARRSR